MYPSFVAGILSSARRIHYFVLYNEELNYDKYIEMCIGDKQCSVCYKSHAGHYFQLSYQSETIFISFQARLFLKLPTEIIFAQSVLKKYIWAMWMFWNVPEFCGGDSEFSKTNPFLCAL